MKRLFIVLLLLGIAAAAAKLFILEIPTVTGNDMAPALQAGDRLLAYRLDTTPRRGDLVLIEHPEGKQLLLRRVVAIPGDRVAVRQETPVINGKPASRKAQRDSALRELAGGTPLKVRIVEERLPSGSGGDDGPQYLVLKDPQRRSVDVKEQTLGGSYFVLADHRNHGTDSRTFGPVAAGKIRGVITHRITAGPGTLAGQGPREGWTSLR
jgi:signal peptidase I